MKSKKSLLRPESHQRGFALIVTLSLMILLTVIAVGLLTLSSISLRSSSQSAAMGIARANAKMALLFALGDLQKQLGPDTRISATADQIPSSDGSASSTPQDHRQWTGAYKSWPTARPELPRPTPEFIQWFVSGDPTSVDKLDFAADTSGTSVPLATSISVGNGDPVNVPRISQRSPDGSRGACAWWVSDLGTKALVAAPKEIPTALAEVRADQQSAPAVELIGATSGTSKPFSQLAAMDPGLGKVISQGNLALLADKPENARGLFHDFTASSRGLLTNVRKGGFRQDLSMQLERSPATAPPANPALYTVNGEPGINLNELWAYYYLSSTSNSRGVKRTGGATFTTGGNMTTGTPYLQLENGPAACQNDDSFYFKQPVIVSYQLALSFQSMVVSGVNQLQLVADPILTFWNPLDVPVVVPANSFFTVKYWQVPYDLMISKNGGAFEKYPLAAALSNANNANDGDSNFLSLTVGQLQPLVFRPGEVIKMSQVGRTLAKSAAGDPHKLGGGKGFNFGGGMSVPVKTRAGTTLTLGPTDTINFKALPNNLTAGATTKDGNSISGGASHSRHFSLTHHEYYVGYDRADLDPA